MSSEPTEQGSQPDLTEPLLAWSAERETPPYTPYTIDSMWSLRPGWWWAVSLVLAAVGAAGLFAAFGPRVPLAADPTVTVRPAPTSPVMTRPAPTVPTVTVTAPPVTTTVQVAPPATANADVAFINTLQSDGWHIAVPADVVATAHGVCAQLAGSPQLTDTEAASTLAASTGWTINAAYQFAAAAHATYCAGIPRY
jgi:hypothetical protein